MIQGFKDFIARGNAIDLAVGVVIGAAFTQVITALTEGVLNPLIGALFGKPDFTHVGEFQLHLWGDPAVIQPGAVLTALVNFLLVALALYFCVVLPLNKLATRRSKGDAEEAAEEAPSAEAELLREIRDTLRGQQG